jgi:hypothetical protein
MKSLRKSFSMLWDLAAARLPPRHEQSAKERYPAAGEKLPVLSSCDREGRVVGWAASAQEAAEQYNAFMAASIGGGIVNPLTADDFCRKTPGDCAASIERSTEFQVDAVKCLGAWECRWCDDQLVIFNGRDRRE